MRTGSLQRERAVGTRGKVHNLNDRVEVERAVDVGEAPTVHALMPEGCLHFGWINDEQHQIAPAAVEGVRDTHDLRAAGTVDEALSAQRRRAIALSASSADLPVLATIFSIPREVISVST